MKCENFGEEMEFSAYLFVRTMYFLEADDVSTGGELMKRIEFAHSYVSLAV